MERSLYDTLCGNWSVNRAIDDRTALQQGTFAGTAQFSGEDHTLHYREEGSLSFAGTQMRAERRYRWHCDGNQADVFYEDGTLFHQFAVTDGTASAEHLCGQDLYRGDYTFRSADTWEVTWRVSGPRKDYTSVTTYRRGRYDQVRRDENFYKTNNSLKRQ